MRDNSILGISFVLALFAVTGCARDIGGNVYSESSVNEAVPTYEGTIVSVEQVVVKGNEKVSENKTGALLGGVAGGVAGNMIGKGKGRTAMTALGALAGAVGGAYAEDALTKQTAMRYTVKLEDGRMFSVVQGKDIIYQRGQKVRLAISGGGRSRIVSAAY